VYFDIEYCTWRMAMVIYLSLKWCALQTAVSAWSRGTSF